MSKKHDHTTEYVTAFVVGALVGVGVALMMAPEPPTRRDRLMKELKPYRKQLKKKTAGFRKRAGQQATAAAEWRDELMDASRSVMKDLRNEVADLVADARNEIASAAETQLDTTYKKLRKGAKRIRT